MLDEYKLESARIKVSEIKEIIDLVKQAPKEAVRFEVLDLLFTPEELVQLEARYAIIKSLWLGHETQRELAARLKLSIAKITRGSHALKAISPELKAYFGDFFHEE
jgi:TrpR family transcriptional regulator, trp operon repressor